MSVLLRLRQRRQEDLAEYRKRFVATTDVLEHMGVVIGGALVKIADAILEKDFQKTREAATDIEANQAETSACDRLFAVVFIKSADQ